MLSIGKITGSPGSAAKYYASGDYYTKDGNEPAEWYGKGANHLGMKGPVSEQDLTKLLSGKLPEGHEAGWEKANNKHHPGWDLTFSAPKGVSILSIVGGDKRLLKAHDKAVDRALKFVETYAHVRVREDDGKISRRHTGNIVAARFTEYFSRALDPHLHTHSPISNLTFDKERGRWYALDSGALYTIKMAAGQIYRNELAASCKTLGYNIIRNAESGLFDIKGIPEQLREVYSSRRLEIMKYAEKRGWKSATALAVATLLTRPNKAKTNHERAVEDLKERAGKHLGDIRSLIRNSSAKAMVTLIRSEQDIGNQKGDVADQATTLGIAHLTNREAVVEHGHILQEALKADIGKVTADDIGKVLDLQEKDKHYQKTEHQTGSKHIYHGRTTDRSLALEARLEHQILNVREKVWPLANMDAAKDHLSKTSLTSKQKEAALFVLRSRDRAIIVAGVAGSGKSHLVRAIKEGAPHRNYLALAPTATAAIDLGKSAGVAADTLAGFLQTGGNKTGRNTILFVDESSMSSSRQTIRLMEIAEKRKARIVFFGDAKQFDAIEQGKPFDLLMDMGLRKTFIDQSFRQKNLPMHTLVQAARDGDVKKMFTILGDRLEQHAAEGFAQTIAEKWINDPNRTNIQIAALDNSSRVATNAVLRKMLQQEGVVGKKDHSFKILSSKGLTPARLSLADFYKPGDVVVFHLGQAALKAKKSDKFRVLQAGAGKVQLERLTDGKTVEFDPKKIRKQGMTLYDEQKRKLAVGDKIQWRQNLTQYRNIKNGHTGTIDKIKDGKATISFDHGIKRTLNLRKYQYWDYGYVITTYKQQGKTTPVNWIIANTQKAGEITQKTLYVSLTRAERSVRVFTDNVRKFRHAVYRNPGGKTSSLQGLGIKVDLHRPIGTQQLSNMEKLVDNMHAVFRTPMVNLLDSIEDARSGRNQTPDKSLPKSHTDDASMKDHQAEANRNHDVHQHHRTEGRER